MDAYIDAIIEIHCKQLKAASLMPPFFNYSDIQTHSVRKEIMTMLSVKKNTVEAVQDFITRQVFEAVNLKLVREQL